MNKLFLPNIYAKNSLFYFDEACKNEISQENELFKLGQTFEEAGADGIIVYDLSDDDISHEKFILSLRKLTKSVDIPLYAGGHINRFEDVKKYLYAGAKVCIIDDGAKDSLTGSEIISDAVERFGDDKTAVRDAAGRIALNCGIIKPVFSAEDIMPVLTEQLTAGVTGEAVSSPDFAFYKVKSECIKNDIPVNAFTPAISFSELKVNDSGLIPVIVQDYKTDEVLMMAWMNEASFNATAETGMMTYFSRSRNELWVKGETSGHYQYVRSISVDCDNDTLLAKVKQVGAACHTGERSCFYRELYSKETNAKNPLKVFSEVMDVINDRKEHPKEGSYTTYLFEQGLDKVLKKCGEEASEVIIAAKNADPEEIKYEMADFLYHAMVLMSMKGVTWEDITKELANR